MTTRTIPQTIPIGFTGVFLVNTGAPIPDTIYVVSIDVLGMSGTIVPQYIFDNAGVDTTVPLPNYQNTGYYKLCPTTQLSAGTSLTTDGTYEFQADAGLIGLNVTVAPTTAVTLRARSIQGATAGGGSGGTASTVADGANVVEGTTTDAAVTGDNAGTMKAALRGITKILGSVIQTVKAASTAAVATDTALVVAVSPNNVLKVGDGTTTLTMKAASTAAAAADVAAVVAISPNNTVPVKQVAGAFTVTQVSLSTSAAQIVAANTARQGLVIKNMDAAIVIYLGATGVTSSTGYPLAAGESVALSISSGAWFGVAASATPKVAAIEV